MNIKFFRSPFLILLPLLIACISCSKSAIEKPNIIWIMAEDIAPDLECYGMKGVKTPHLNRMRGYMTKWKSENHDHGFDVIDKVAIVHPEAVDVLEWITSERPGIYTQMQEGIEPGFQRLSREYRSLNQNN